MPSAASTCKYFAFISYSRKDSKVAAWLQKRLEWFRFPVKLVPEDRRPPNPKYVRPVYRDKTNLEVTDEHYWTNIRRALEESRFLIVLCSPNSARSEPVNMEVKHFLEVHGGDTSRVVPVIVGGNVMDTGEHAALCPALRDLSDPDGKFLTDRNLPTMLSDADIAEQDAWESGFVALSSYLLHLERGAIGDHIRLEARKQTRVLRRWLTAVGALTIIATVSAWLALQAKQEVEKANAINLKNLHEASMADYNVAVQRIEKDGKWHEGVAHLARSLKWDPSNSLAATRLYSTLAMHAPEAQSWPREILHHADRVNCVEFSLDGSLIVTASNDKTARVWDATTGKALGEPLRHKDRVNSAEFSPDGSLIVTASNDKTARVWDATTGKALGEPLRHEDVINSAKFSPEGTRIVTASSDKTVRVWDVTTCKALGEPLRHEGRIRNAEFCSDGTRILTEERDHNLADSLFFVWEALSGELLSGPRRSEHYANEAMFSPDCKRIASSRLDEAEMWDASLNTQLGQSMIHEDTVWCINFSPDSTRIVTASADKTARVWDAASGKPLGKPLQHESEVIHAQFSPDGARIVTASRDCTVLVWDALGYKPLGEPIMHGDTITELKFSPSGKSIVTMSEEIVKVWDVTSGVPQGEPLRHYGPVRTAEYSPDCTRIVTTTSDTVQIWDAKSGKQSGETLQRAGGVTIARFSPDGTQILVLEDTGIPGEEITVWDAVSGEMRDDAPIPPESFFAISEFSPDGTRILREETENGVSVAVRVCEATSGHPFGEPLRHEGNLLSAQFSPVGTSILTTSNDNTARIWDTRLIQPPPDPLPSWMLQYVHCIAGLDFDVYGEMQAIPAEQRRAILSTLPLGDDAWARLARWLAQPAHDRTLTPDSKFTCRQIAERERDSGFKEGIESALRYDPTVPLAHVLLAKFEENPQRADFLRGYGLKLLPPDDVSLWARAATSLAEQKDFKRAVQAAEKALILDTKNAEAKKAMEAAKQQEGGN